jgi:hypothetical protein
MTNQQVLDYYTSKLIVQYRTKPNALATIELLANLAFCDGLMEVEPTCFDLETAVGAQLDILGRIVGVPREVYGLDLEHTFFNFTRYIAEPTSIGFGRYADDPYSADLFWRYNFLNSAVYTLTDVELLTLIKLKIILNNIYSSFKNLKEAIYDFFGSDIDVMDNKDMTLTYNIKTELTNAGAAAVFLGLLAKPAGVGLIVNYI